MPVKSIIGMKWGWSALFTKKWQLLVLQVFLLTKDSMEAKICKGNNSMSNQSPGYARTRLLTVYLQKYICLVHLTFLKRGTLTTFDGICNSIKPNTRRSNISYSIVMQTFLLAACVPRKKKSDNPTHAPKTFPLHHPPFPPLIWVFSSWVFRWLKRLLVHCHYYGTGAHCACTLAQFPEISFHIRLHD